MKPGRLLTTLPEQRFLVQGEPACRRSAGSPRTSSVTDAGGVMERSALGQRETPMPLANARHDCPGQCGRRVVHSMLACGPCWPLLPQDLRDAVTKAENIRRRDPKHPDRIRAHRQAIVAAVAWYRQNTGATP